MARARGFADEFDAKVLSCDLYHYHALPLRWHMAKGIYGTCD